MYIKKTISVLVNYSWLVLRLKHTLAYNHSYCWFISTFPGIILAYVNWHSLKQCLDMVWKSFKLGTVSSWYFKAECFALSGREQSSVGMIRSMPFDTGPREWVLAILFTLNNLRPVWENQEGEIDFNRAWFKCSPHHELIYRAFFWALFLLLAAHWLCMCSCSWSCKLKILLPTLFFKC